tara:strand:- start:625 stop:1530 length:906 start_codon:yes stop_codon:yes gene_type:complete
MAKESPFKVDVATAATVASVGLQAIGQIGGKRARKRARRQARQATEQQLAFQREQLALLEKQKDVYRSMEFTNPYEGMQNPFANLENPYEDLTVNQQQAQFLAQQGAQQRADILGGLRSAAGSSGVAGLAQSLANQQQIQAQKMSASIGMQEARNQALMAQGAERAQMAEARGQAAVDMAVLGGDAMVQQAEMARQATLLGVAYGGAAGANQGVQQAFANQMQADMIGQQMQADRFNALSDLAISAAGSGMFDNMFTGGGGTSNFNNLSLSGGSNYNFNTGAGVLNTPSLSNYVPPPPNFN